MEVVWKMACLGEAHTSPGGSGRQAGGRISDMAEGLEGSRACGYLAAVGFQGETGI